MREWQLSGGILLLSPKGEASDSAGKLQSGASGWQGETVSCSGTRQRRSISHDAAVLCCSSEEASQTFLTTHAPPSTRSVGLALLEQPDLSDRPRSHKKVELKISASLCIAFTMHLTPGLCCSSCVILLQVMLNECR